MKAFRLLRWSGSVLSPRTRPCYLYPQLAHTYRFQSSAASQLQPEYIADNSFPSSPIPPQDADHSQDLTADQTPEIDLRIFPSPPPSRAASSAKLSALHARLFLSPRLPIETLARCLVDSSADPHPLFNNASLSILGTDLLGYHISEAILCRYPRLPTDVVLAAMWAYCGPKTLETLTREWGVEVAAAPGGEVDPGYLQCKRVQAGNADFEGTGIMVKEVEKSDSPAVHDWRRSINSRAMVDSEFGDPVTRTPIDYAERPELRSEEAHRLVELAVTVELASSNFVRALVGAVYLHCGKKAAKVFIKEHILSRDLNYVKLFDFRQPTRELNKLCAREGFDPPLARILRESGRLTRSPVFIVGVFAGKEKLGEGIGGSLDEARIKAAIAALKGWYLYSPPELRVPSESEGPSAKPWQPVMIDGGDVVV